MAEGTKGHGCLTAFIVVILIVAVGFVGVAFFLNEEIQKEENATYEWPHNGPALMLPRPTSNVGKITTDTSTDLTVEVHDQSPSDYRDYVAACKDKGFTEDASETSSSYSASTSEGAKLRLNYFASGEELHIDLSVPSGPSRSARQDGASSAREAAGSLSGTADGASSSKGDEAKENKDATPESQAVDAGASSAVKAAETPQQQVETEVAQAESAVENLQQAAELASAAASIAQNATPGEVTPEFKELMDGYEAFMNQYCDFMVRYENAQGADLAAMLADYASMLQQEAAWMEKVDAIDEGALSVADDAYYLEVTARVLSRLAEVTGSVSTGS